MVNLCVILLAMLILGIGFLAFTNTNNLIKAQQNIEWKTYTSKKLGFSIEYPSSVYFKKEGEKNTLSPTTLLQIGSDNDPFVFMSDNQGKPGIKFKDEVKKFKDAILKTTDQDTHVNLIKDISPITFEGVQGYSFLISKNNITFPKIVSLSNITSILHNNMIHSFVFTFSNDKYDKNIPIFNHMLTSIRWIN